MVSIFHLSRSDLVQKMGWVVRPLMKISSVYASWLNGVWVFKYNAEIRGTWIMECGMTKSCNKSLVLIMSSSIIANIDTFSPCLHLRGSFLLGKTCRTMTGGSWYCDCYILPATRAQQHPNWIHHPDLFKHVRITQTNTRYQIPTGEFKEIYIPIHFQYANNGKMMIPSHPFFHPPACPSTIGLAMIDMAQRCCATGWKLEGFSSYSCERRRVPGLFPDRDGWATKKHTTQRNHRVGCNANIVFSACKKNDTVSSLIISIVGGLESSQR